MRRQSRPLCRQLQAIDPALAALSSDIEQRFLACGRALQEQVNLTSRLGEQARRLQQFDSRPNHGETSLQCVSSLMHAHLDLSEDLTREVQRLASTLERYAGHLHALLSDQQQLERSFAPMRVLHSFFRIESASLAAEQQALFHAVTAEMQRLHASVTSSFADHAAALSATRERVLAAAGSLHARSAHDLELVQRKRTEVRAALARLESKLDEDRNRHARLQSAISQLDRETDRITVGLQFQDITRQKMEHVQAAARTVLAQFTAHDGTPFHRRARAQQVLCQVQTVQLDSVQAELAQAADTISTGLRALLEQLQTIETDGLSLERLHQMTAGMDDTLNEMRDVHRVTAELTRGSVESFAAAIQSARGFAQATTGATDTMRRLADDLLLMGLNAQVQALQAKSGCLEVLSSAVSNMSSEAGALTLEFEHKLAATTADLAQFVHNSESVHAHAHERHRTLGQRDATVLPAFTAECESAQAIVTEVGTLLRELRLQADELLASIDLATFSREPIAQARELFASLATILAPIAGATAATDAALLADVESRYTMNSERAAHAAVIGAATAAANRANAAASPAAIDPAPVAATSPGARPDASAPDQLGDNVELF